MFVPVTTTTPGGGFGLFPGRWLRFLVSKKKCFNVKLYTVIDPASGREYSASAGVIHAESFGNFPSLFF